MGTNGTEIAKRVAAELGYRLYDTEAVENAMREMGFLKDVREIEEKGPPLLRKFFSHKPAVAFDRLNSVIYKLASHGDAVFLGRGSNILLRAFKCALHVRVTASLGKRIQNLVERGFPQEVAAKAIEKSDHERAAFARFAFGVDWDNPVLYDLVLNMDHLSVDLAVRTVLNIARTEEIRARSVDAMRSLEMMSLASRVEAALVEAGLTYGPVTSVSVSVIEPGRIRLAGYVESENSKVRAEKILKEIKGIESIDNQIRVVEMVKYG